MLGLRLDHVFPEIERFCPVGTQENSPAFQCRISDATFRKSPVGTTEKYVNSVNSAVPTGLGSISCHVPGSKLPGYYLTPLRG
jgi:hypothetical protein